MHDLLGEVLVTRQPILDRDLLVVGYELRPRELTPGGADAALDPAAASHGAARVLVDGVLALGLEELTGGDDAWVPVPAGLLVADGLLDLPREHLVLEVGSDPVPPDELGAAIDRHREAGFRLVLADVGAEDPRAAAFGRVDACKVQVGPEWRATLPLVRSLVGAGHRVAVAGVEDPDAFDELVAAGVSFVQGFFFTRPRAVRGVRPLGLAPGHLALLRALAADEVDLAEVERLIRSDLTLSDRFLRLVRVTGGPRPVDSIHHGLVRLGVRAVQRWVSLLLLSATAREAPAELVAVASARARACELLEEVRGGTRRLEAFCLGMFSVLGPDGLLDEDTLAALPVEGDVERALRTGEGPLRGLLDLQLASEQADWAGLARQGERLGLQPREVARASAEALSWSVAARALR